MLGTFTPELSLMASLMKVAKRRLALAPLGGWTSQTLPCRYRVARPVCWLLLLRVHRRQADRNRSGSRTNVNCWMRERVFAFSSYEGYRTAVAYVPFVPKTGGVEE